MATGWSKWAPLSGVVYVALWVIGFFVFGDGPPDSDDGIVEYFKDSGNQNGHITFYFLVMATSLFFLWFAVQLRQRLAVAEGRAGMRTALAYGAALIMTTLHVVASVVFMSTAFAMGEDEFVLDPNTFRLLDGLGYAVWFSGTMIGSLVVLSTALVSLKGGFLPKWLTWLSFLVAAGMLVAIFWIPFWVWLLWVLLVSVVMIMKPAAGETAAA